MLTPPRRGISLLEVLIGIFVLAFGLLGIAAIIPAGRATVAEASDAERCGAAGRAALRKIRVRRMLQPMPFLSGDSLYWADPTGKSIPTPQPQPVAFCIDPLLAAHVRGAGGDGSNISNFPSDQSASLYMPRVTFALPGASQPSTSAAAVMPESMAQRIFVCRDELALDYFSNSQFRPRQLYTYSGGQVREYPPRADPSYGAPLANWAYPVVAETQNGYSWMCTVTPASTEFSLAPGDFQLFNVSVVVFHNRSLNAPLPSDILPAERVAKVAGGVFGPGMGGGSLNLTASQDSWLDMKTDQWLMLCGNLTKADGSPLPLFAWYKIVTTDPVSQGSRNVTLAGPDWPSSSLPTQAVLLTSVVGVYTNTMQLDFSAIWSK